MARNILVTGGAGFIGSHLTDELLSAGHRVKVYDNLTDQVHGPGKKPPEYLNKHAEFIYGDVRDKGSLQKALKGIDAVYHLAAVVGVGQSMYEIQKYTEVNNIGTAVLLEALIEYPVKKLIVASSMSIYGEGLYKDKSGNVKKGSERTLTQFKSKNWEIYDSEGEVLIPFPTPENKVPNLTSIYALSKYDQEIMSLMIGKAYNIPTVALRFFNVYGTRQALSNPYTGVLAIFASRLLNDKPPVIYEDGKQQRDFVNVKDVARACKLALENTAIDGGVFNIGSGNAYKITQIAEKLAGILNKNKIKPVITGKYRIGDIRHCFADISRAEKLLGYKPMISLETGLQELSEWLVEQKADDKVDFAGEQLAARGLTI